jgi:hypothetical protein
VPLSYTTAAQVLLALAASPDGVVHTGAKDDPVRRVLRVAAEACERVDQAQADRETALLYAAEVRGLLDRMVVILDTLPLPIEGGTWDSYLISHYARILLRQEPLTVGRALRNELHVSRVAARAAAALLAAQQEGDPARIRMCTQVLQHASIAFREVTSRARLLASGSQPFNQAEHD